MNAGGKEVVFEGLGVSPGIAVGPAHLSEAGMPTVPEYAIRKSAVGAENERLKTAVERSGRQLRRLRDRARSVHGASGEDLGSPFDSPRLRGEPSQGQPGIADRAVLLELLGGGDRN